MHETMRVCLSQVMLDVPSIGGRLVLVDMAGSENLDQAGMGTDLKMQVKSQCPCNKFHLFITSLLP
jgi:hypothetical protein